MTDQPASPSAQPAPAGAGSLPAVPGSPTTDGAGKPLTDRAGELIHDRPELAVGAVFAGAFLLAQILRRIAH
ncbi:MAG: hypothetical protein JOZ98_06955 [Solirubrobacterales bacterium]|nr:hypothetical protein [Solirubrobacterales bacterium]MBV9422629.1 hypothetical protein [Solirubrobacterales bacterium]MBV9800107.1 hypothetical protein [Solirubrobacterales bacterium]